VQAQQQHQAGIRETVRALKLAGKSNRGAPLYSRLINRPLGRVFAAVAFRLGLTPNQVTVLSACFTFSGILVIALVRPSPLMGLGVAALLILGYALDSSDGQLARLRGGGSLTGEWLDHMIDAVKNPTIHIAVLVSFYRYFEFERDAVLLIPALFSAVASVQFFRYIFTDQLRGAHVAALARDDAGRPSMLRSLLALPSDYGLLCLATATLGFKGIFVVWYTALLVGTVAYLGVALRNAYRSIRALDEAAASDPRVVASVGST
jgi:phosphatidylglycerophosphate synthase